MKAFTMGVEVLTKIFEQNTVRKEKNGSISIDCKKGLWGVAGPISKKGMLESEARHYFLQYFEDGEYDTPNTPIQGERSDTLE